MGLLKTDCFSLIRHAIDAINPQKLIRNNLKLINDGQCLLVNNKQRYDLKRNVYVAAFGKAVYGMCTEVEQILDKHLVRGIAILPDGLQADVKQIEHAKIEYMFGARNNIPDASSYEAANKLFAMCESLSDNDLLIALISGGGSALLSLPLDGISLADKISTTKLIAACGASINELNIVRMCLSKTKAGGIAKAAYPARVLAFIISDVLDDPIEIIASGPTCVSHLEQLAVEKRQLDSLAIIKKYNLQAKLPEHIVELLCRSPAVNTNRNYQQTDDLMASTQNIIIGTNRFATEAIRDHAIELNYEPVVILTNSLSGEASECGMMFAYLAFILCDVSYYWQNESFFANSFQNDLKADYVRVLKNFLSLSLNSLNGQTCKKTCILSGGETTVNLLDNDGHLSNGIGGRNQELTLAFKKKFTELLRVKNLTVGNQVLFTSFGTDGIDGPTDSAGAFALFPCNQSPTIINNSNDLERMGRFLRDHNSYTYFNNTENHIKIGHTGTNVSDLQILLITR
jgi:glycerate 2-kinase